MEIRRIRPDEAATLRAIRLRALADAPDAFEDTLVEAQQQDDAFWAGRTARNAEGHTSVTLFAEDGGRCVGMTSAFVSDDLAGFAMVAALWVEPEHRRQGIGRTLVEAAAEWGHQRGVQQLRLWVAESNEAARALFIGSSFEPTVASRKMPGREAVREMLMVRTI